jgi:hypothetical protein
MSPLIGTAAQRLRLATAAFVPLGSKSTPACPYTSAIEQSEVIRGEILTSPRSRVSGVSIR